MAAPTSLLEFHQLVIEKAQSFGFNGQNGQLRDTIFDKGNLVSYRKPDSNESNYWFGFIREDQPTSKAYEGLSFVVFPECEGTHCVASIGVGSSTTGDTTLGSLGPDMELAMNPSFARSFRTLTKKEHSGARFFFKLDFTDTVNPTPRLKEALEESTPSFEDAMVNTVAVYDHGDKGGLLPASILVDYSTEDGIYLIISWLAQYAEWRNWSSYKNGNTRTGYNTAIKKAIKLCVAEKDVIGSDAVLDILKEKRFVVLQGAPGCGKTWMANKISQKPFFTDKKEVEDIEECSTDFIQFHAETSYADFIYGIKPVLSGDKLAYTSEKGVLLNVIDKALKYPKNNYLLIIDEINRANLANVLGPVFYLFEQTAEERTHKLILGRDKENKTIEYDHIPDNMYVVATMNTADKSLAVVDFALRRRFSWVTLRPHEIDDVPKKLYFDRVLFKEIDVLFSRYANDEELSLQPGQSYFIYPKDNPQTEESIFLHRKDLIQYKLMPLIKEYLSEGYLLSAKDSFAQLFYQYEVRMYE
jgi:5-methylcytosine-specific restriction protein B